MGYADEKELDFSIERFSGIDQGMEGNDSPMQCSQNAANCDTSGGVLKLACGWALDEKIGDTPAPIRTLMYFHKRNDDGLITTYLLAATDNCVYRQDGLLWVDIAGACPVTCGTFSWINYQKGGASMIIMANGADDVYCWTGDGTLTRLAANADWVESHPMADNGTNIIHLSHHGLKDNDKIVFDTNKGKLPSGLSAKDTYFVVAKNADSFQVTTKSNGSAINLKSGGTMGWRVASAKWLGDVTPDVSISSDVITITKHGLINDDELIFDNFTGRLPSGIKDKTSYFALVTSENTFKITKTKGDYETCVNLGSDGGSNWRVRKAALSNWLKGAPSATVATHAITLTNHGLASVDSNKNNTAVEFGVEPTALLPGGLKAGTTYYVKNPSGNAFNVSTSTDIVDIVDFANVGVGGWSLRGLYANEWISDTITVNATNNTIMLDNTAFAENDPVVFGIADENSYIPDGLFAGVVYYTKNIDENSFQLLTTKESGTAVAISSIGMSGWGVRRKSASTWLGVPTVNVTAGIITIANHGLNDGDDIVLGLDESRMLPDGLHANTIYYVVSSTAGTFKLSKKKDGAAIINTEMGIPGWRIRPNGGVWKLNPPIYQDTQTIRLASHGFKNGDAVQVDIPTTDSFLPEGIAAHNGTPDGKFYYVVNATQHSFMVADKPGGDPVKFKSAGTSAFRVRLSRENRPMGGSLALHCERVWAAGEMTRPDSAFYSDDTDPTNWTIGADAAGVMSKPTWDGDSVSAVANIFDNVVVFKSKSMFRIAGTSPGEYQIAPVLSSVGTVSPATICQWQNAAFFLSPSGIMVYDGTKCELLGGSALKSLYATMNTKQDVLCRACATVWNGHLLMALPVKGSIANNCVVDFDIAAGTFMLRTGIQVDCWLPGDQLSFACGNKVWIWGCGASPEAMYWETPETDMGSRTAMKTVTGVYVTGKGGNVKITVKADKNIACRIAELPAEGRTVKIDFCVRGRLISLAVENVSGSIEISGITVLYEREDD